jgi:hypothetical protein
MGTPSLASGNGSLSGGTPVKYACFLPIRYSKNASMCRARIHRFSRTLYCCTFCELWPFSTEGLSTPSSSASSVQVFSSLLSSFLRSSNNVKVLKDFPSDLGGVRKTRLSSAVSVSSGKEGLQ